jgi:hypothetical protein
MALRFSNEILAKQNGGFCPVIEASHAAFHLELLFIAIMIGHRCILEAGSLSGAAGRLAARPR